MEAKTVETWSVGSKLDEVNHLLETVETVNKQLSKTSRGERKRTLEGNQRMIEKARCIINELKQKES